MRSILARAFEIATAKAPNTKLIINQHGDMEETMWDKIKALVPYHAIQKELIDAAKEGGDKK